MSYTALYRKWRPERFEDVKGQDAIVRTLKNQIAMGRIGHAYLFCGTRGTGKTTVAKIFAKAVNCENPKDGNPCLECASCKAIAASSSMNVMEIDAATYNGVDKVRDIVEDVAYSPAFGKYKVYIIDEAHNLSEGAFNALLKTLEEPPEYAIFILATTETHKILVTIQSRCQRYDFKRISVDTIFNRLKELAAGESVDAEDRALRYIARMADGALRDAISLFDQCNSFYLNETLTYDKVLEVLGTADTVVFSELVRDIMAGDLNGAVKLLDSIIIQGRELSQFITDLTWYLRNLLFVKNSDQMAVDDILDVTSESLKRLEEEAELLDRETIIRYIRIFSGLSGELKYSSQKRVLTEIAFIKLCRPEMETDYSSITERVRILEAEIDRLTEAINEIRLDPSKAGSIQLEKREEAVKTEVVPLPENIEEKVIEAGKKRLEITSYLTNMMKHMLNGAVWSAEKSDKLLIIPKDGLIASYLRDEVYMRNLDEAITKVVGSHVDFEIKSPVNEPLKKEIYTELGTISGIDMEIEEEEE